jgi:hypothetical protein
MQHSLKLGGTNYHFKRVKVSGTTPYWKAWVFEEVDVFYKESVFLVFEEVDVFYKESVLLVHLYMGEWDIVVWGSCFLTCNV